MWPGGLSCLGRCCHGGGPCLSRVPQHTGAPSQTVLRKGGKTGPGAAPRPRDAGQPKPPPHSRGLSLQPWPLRARTMLTSVLMPSCALSSRLSEQLCTTWPCSCSELSLHRPSQVALEVKNPPGNAGEVRDPRSIPGSKRSPGGEHATRSSILVEHPTVRGVGGRPSMGSQRGGHA